MHFGKYGMERKKFEQIIHELADCHYESVTKAPGKLVPSIGRMNNFGDWVPEKFELSEEFTQADHLIIKRLKKAEEICNFCRDVVQGQPTVHIQCKRGRYQTENWAVKCRQCKKEIEYRDFVAISKQCDK
jgi:hypothetical protein